MAKLTAPQVQHFLTACGQKGLSPRTIEYVRAVLRVALNRACKWDLIPRNVVTLTESPRRVRRPVQPLDPVEAKALIASVKGKRLEALFVTALATGMRQGELLGLKWEDIDLGNARLHVRRALQRVDGKLTFVDPKTQQSLRSVRIPKLVVEQLEAHRVRQLEDRLAAGKDWQDSGLVF